MNWLSWFRNETFCCVFSLQSGAVVSIMILTGLGITSLVNIIYFLATSSSFVANIAPFCIALAYLLVLAVGLVFAFTGAYTESTFWMVMGSLFTAIAILIYIVICIISFLPSMYSISCFALRCPEHLWLQRSYWRSYGKDPESNANDTDLGEERYGEILQTTTLKPRTTTRLISHRRLRPNPVTRAYMKDKGGPYLLGEKGRKKHLDKEEFLCQKLRRKLSDEIEEEDYCPPEGRSGDGDDDSGVQIFSIIWSVLYFICFLAFQLYCLWGFLCFANELKKELG